MKNILLAAIMLLSIHTFAGVRSASLTASGLTCSMCSRSIYKALTNIPYVRSVDANVEKSSFEITFTPGSRVSFDDLKKAVQDAGFSVASLTAVISFSSVPVNNDALLAIDGISMRFINVSHQELTGDKTIKIVDKGFLPLKEYKKLGAPKDEEGSKRVYHVTL